MCLFCNSLERHRFLYFIYKKYFLNTKEKIAILHTAPEKSIYHLIKKNKNIEYKVCDIKPEYYDFCKCEKEDITNLSYKDNSFDFVISNHVIEHILDEDKFFNELIRVLKKNGKLLLSFPVSNNDKTFEDKSITSRKDRLKYFGQEDHVRMYGQDVFNKFITKYNAKVIYVKDVLSDKEINDYSIMKQDFCMIIEK